MTRRRRELILLVAWLAAVVGVALAVAGQPAFLLLTVCGGLVLYRLDR